MHLYSHKLVKPRRTAAVVRYGGFGDALQAASVLPWLKADGYHVTFYTVPGSAEVVRYDPNIDRLVVQDADAIPNELLGEFWRDLASKYDRFINLSESTERTLLAMPNTTQHGWSTKMRHKYLNINYLTFVHDIAGVPPVPKMAFYPTDEESAWAREEVGKMGRTIMWILSGSAVHKVWPYFDYVIDKVMHRNDGTNFVLVSDPGAKVLERGWENVPRIHLRSGEWSIRQTMAFAQQASLVIGPETGVLNAIAYAEVAKIVILSHSSIENLTKDWVNCVSLYPMNTGCYPCHQMHFGWEFCSQYENTGIARCQEDIAPDRMIEAIDKLLHTEMEGDSNGEALCKAA